MTTSQRRETVFSVHLMEMLHCNRILDFWISGHEDNKQIREAGRLEFRAVTEHQAVEQFPLSSVFNPSSFYFLLSKHLTCTLSLFLLPPPTCSTVEAHHFILSLCPHTPSFFLPHHLPLHLSFSIYLGACITRLALIDSPVCTRLCTWVTHRSITASVGRRWGGGH